MAHRMLRPFALLNYVLFPITAFLISIYLVKLSGVTENQGLAAAGIAVGYALMGGCIGIIASLFCVNRLSSKSIKNLNWVLFLISGLLILYSYIQYTKRAAADEKPIEQHETRPNTDRNSLIVWGSFGVPDNEQNDDMGVGVFQIDLATLGSTYLFSNPESASRMDRNLAMDSIRYTVNAFGTIEISYAPPWLFPLHQKTDYEILFFKVIALQGGSALIEVNKATGKKVWVSIESGFFKSWPEFLLKLSAIDPKDQELKIAPSDQSAALDVNYVMLTPMRIERQWMKVGLVDEDYDRIQEAWIKWTDGKQLLIDYSLLS